MSRVLPICLGTVTRAVQVATRRGEERVRNAIARRNGLPGRVDGLV